MIIPAFHYHNLAFLRAGDKPRAWLLDVQWLL
jgi:hypothetical protein